MDKKRGVMFITSVVVALLVFSPVAAQDYIALQGSVSGATTGNITVEIYDAASGGNLLYNSTKDFWGQVNNSRYDILIGNGSNDLFLNFGTHYYMNIILNEKDMNFNDTNRQVFQSPTGNITMSSPISTTSTAANAFTLSGFNVSGANANVETNGTLQVESGDVDDALNVTGGVRVQGASTLEGALTVTSTAANAFTLSGFNVSGANANVETNGTLQVESGDVDDALNVTGGGVSFASNAANDGAFRIDNNGALRVQNNDADDALNVTGGVYISGQIKTNGQLLGNAPSGGVPALHVSAGEVAFDSTDLNDALNVSGGVIIGRQIGSNFSIGGFGWTVNDQGIMKTRDIIGSGGSITVLSSDAVAFTVNNGFNISDTNDMKTNGSITVTAGGTAQVPSAITVDDDVVVGFGNVGLGAADAAINWDATNTRWVFAGGNDVMGPATLFRVDPLQLGNATFNISEVNSLVQTNLSVQIQNTGTNNALNLSAGGMFIGGELAVIGTDDSTTQHHIDIFDGGVNKCGYIALYDDTGGDWYLFVNSTGDLRVNTGIPDGVGNCNTAGEGVGGQPT